MPVHPQLPAVLDAAAAHPERSPFTATDPAEARARYLASNAVYAPETPPMAQVEDIAVAGPAGAIPVRVYRPENAGDDTCPRNGFCPWRWLGLWRPAQP